MRTDDKTLISALRILAGDLVSRDGVPEAAILEAADRLEQLTCRSETTLPLSVPDLPANHTGIRYGPAETGEWYLAHGVWVQWLANVPTAFFYVVATK